MSLNKNMHILIVDDYNTMLRIMRNLLRQLDFLNIEEATDGEQALSHLRRTPFDLIISDWNMLPMTGLELLRNVRSDEKLRRIPFIMVTSYSFESRVVGHSTRSRHSRCCS